METAAAAIANIIAYNIAVARAEIQTQQAEEPSAASKPGGVFRSVTRNWDVLAVGLVIGSLVTYGASQLRI